MKNLILVAIAPFVLIIYYNLLYRFMSLVFPEFDIAFIQVTAFLIMLFLLAGIAVFYEVGDDL